MQTWSGTPWQKSTRQENKLKHIDNINVREKFANKKKQMDWKKNVSGVAQSVT